MGMGFAPTWLRQVSPLLHKTTLTTACDTDSCFYCRPIFSFIETKKNFGRGNGVANAEKLQIRE